MKKLLLILLCLPFIGFGQGYSTYYLDANVNHNINANINKNVNVSGTINKNVNVSTIDYGALANANAQRESNRLTQQRIAIEQAQYRDAKERNDAILDANRALEIAEDPMKAHTYGYSYIHKGYNSSIKGMEWLKLNGFISFEETMQIPHTSLFENVGGGRWENISADGITTEIIFQAARYNYRNFPYLDFEQAKKYQARGALLYEYYQNNKKPSRKNYRKKYEDYKKDLVRYNEVCDSLDNYGYLTTPKTNSKFPGLIENTMFPSSDGDSAYCHKKKAVKRLVYGHKGYRYSLVWEDDYEMCITDNYESISEGATFFVKVRYKADKGADITFEDLEGRRFYLSKFIDKTIATRKISNEVYASEDKYKPKRRSFSNSEDYLQSFDKWYKKILGN